MRYIALPLFFIAFPFAAFGATFDTDLYFGMRHPDVTRLQEFLHAEGIYSGPVTGSFFSLTKEAVINFQRREKIEPAAGYFGPKTRSRVNAMVSFGQQSISGIPPAASRDEAIAILKAKISELTQQLKSLQELLASEEAPAASPSGEIVTTSTSAVPEVPKIVSELRVSTIRAYPFPDGETDPFKIGEFSVKNTLGKDVLMANFETTIFDEMDSTPNRNRRVFLFLKDGKEATDPQISKTEFTFILTPPKTGEPHKSFVKFPFGILLKNNEEKIVSLWAEQFKFVRAGTLQIKSTKTLVTDPAITSVGEFDFILTKEPAF